VAAQLAASQEGLSSMSDDDFDDWQMIKNLYSHITYFLLKLCEVSLGVIHVISRSDIEFMYLGIKFK
jgi:hypothetical protein